MLYLCCYALCKECAIQICNAPLQLFQWILLTPPKHYLPCMSNMPIHVWQISNLVEYRCLWRMRKGASNILPYLASRLIEWSNDVPRSWTLFGNNIGLYMVYSVSSSLHFTQFQTYSQSVKSKCFYRFFVKHFKLALSS